MDRDVEMRWVSDPIRLPNWEGSARGRGRLFHVERGGSGTPLRETSNSRGVSVWKELVWGEDMLSLYGDGTCSLL